MHRLLEVTFNGTTLNAMPAEILQISNAASKTGASKYAVIY